MDAKSLICCYATWESVIFKGKYTEFQQHFSTFQVYIERWRQQRQNLPGSQFHQMDILYPVNLACALLLPAELEMLIQTGFPTMTIPMTMASCCRIDPFILTSERTVEPNCCSTKCLRVLFQHTPDLSAVFTTEQKISLLKVAIKKQQVHHLQILLENLLTLQLLDNGRGYGLLMDVLSQVYGKNNSREMAKLLIQANCYDKTGVHGNGAENETNFTKYPTPLTMAIVRHPTLVRTMLECGIPIYGQTRKIKACDIMPNLKEAKSRRLYEILSNAQFSDVTLAQKRLDAETLRIFMTYAAHEREHTTSLLFQCRKTIRNRLVYCSKMKVEKLRLPKCLTDYLCFE